MEIKLIMKLLNEKIIASLKFCFKMIVNTNTMIKIIAEKTKKLM